MGQGDLGDGEVEQAPIPDEGLLADMNVTSSADFVMNSSTA